MELKGLEPLTPCLQTTGSTSTRVHLRRSSSKSAHTRPSRSVPVAVPSCCTPGRRCVTAPSRSSLGLHHRRDLRPGRTVPQFGRRERTHQHRHQRAHRTLESAALGPDNCLPALPVRAYPRTWPTGAAALGMDHRGGPRAATLVCPSGAAGRANSPGRCRQRCPAVGGRSSARWSAAGSSGRRRRS